MNDERHGRPSASAMERIAQCPASHKMGQAGKWLVPLADSDEAMAGTRIHAALAGGGELDEHSDEVTREKCEEQFREIAGGRSAIYEQRIWMDKDALTSKERFPGAILSGQFDALCVTSDDERSAILADFKTGRGNYAPASENVQLKTLAVLCSQHYQLDSITVALIQPWRGAPSVHRYDLEALAEARRDILRIVNQEAAATPNDARAGEHCTYCDGRTICPEFRRAALTKPMALESGQVAALLPKLQRLEFWTRAMNLTPEAHAAAFESLAVYNRYADAVEESFTARVASGGVPGWHIVQKAGKRKIVDPLAVFTKANMAGVTPEMFAGACNISFTALTDILKKATLAKGKALEALVAQCTEGATEKSAGKGKPERMEQAEEETVILTESDSIC